MWLQLRKMLGLVMEGTCHWLLVHGANASLVSDRFGCELQPSVMTGGCPKAQTPTLFCTSGPSKDIYNHPGTPG